jgi:serine/threonine-protein kinase HipA
MVKVKGEQVWVWIDDPTFGKLQHIGTLSRGDSGVVRFTYESGWIAHAAKFPLDPKLQLFEGNLYPSSSNFGIFMDSCPDRWGQGLMQRRENIEAKEESRKPNTLDVWDFLLGVQDLTRMGALRFSRTGEQEFLASEILSVPPITSIAELQAAAIAITDGKTRDLNKIKAWLMALMAPGSSLGGAQPKANVLDQDNTLWIAKFPSSDDVHDFGLWEKLLHDLARDCGIDVPESRIMKVGSKHHTFLVKRFDRNGSERRFFASAMTMLGRTEGDDASYLELAEFISANCGDGNVTTDLEELFTRVAFNVAVANRDDHLRNHGFMRSSGGWHLSPAFDMNPSFKKDSHVLAIDIYDRQPDLGVVLSTASDYRLSNDRAARIIEKVCGVVKSWRARAKKLGLSAYECTSAEHLFIDTPPHP